MVPFIIFLLTTALLLWFFFRQRTVDVSNDRDEIKIPPKWSAILQDNVEFYRQLDHVGRDRFEQDCYLFLNHVKVTAIETEIDITDRLLIAASAVIPLFGFPQWTYDTIDEVLLYPSAFDRDFNLRNPDEVITGMVGSGVMEGKMILSKPALRHGFSNAQDKHNVGIHEFVHLFDKGDGVIDGIPPFFENKTFTVPWVQMVQKKVGEILDKDSDIKPYGGTNDQEFFAVASEYFFERPHLLEKKHPELYGVLSKVFRQDLTETMQPVQPFIKTEPKRNDPCPCGSGLKYKKCCAR